MLSARDLAPGSRFAGGPARPPRREPSGWQRWTGQCGAQIRRMRGAQVNLVVGPVKAEAVVQGTRRRENPFLRCGRGFLGLVPGSGV